MIKIDEGKTFPIQTSRLDKNPSPTTRIPWSIAERAYASYAARYGHDQSLERLAERGGFSTGEMDMFAPGWREEVSEIARLRTQLAKAMDVLGTIDAQVDSGAYCPICYTKLGHSTGCQLADLVDPLDAKTEEEETEAERERDGGGRR